jgi:hypothetical protein
MELNLLDEEGSNGGGHRHIASVATPLQPGGSNSASGAELPIIELVGKHYPFGEEAIFGTRGGGSQEGEDRADGTGDSTEGGPGDSAKGASSGPSPVQGCAKAAAAAEG